MVLYKIAIPMKKKQKKNKIKNRFVKPIKIKQFRSKNNVIYASVTNILKYRSYKNEDIS